MRVGTAFFGEVEKVGRQCIRTKFFVLGVPLVPIGSFYFTSSRDFGSVSGKGFTIGLHGTSVLAGYLRVFLGIAFVLLAMRTFLARSSWERTPLDFAYPVIALGLAIASLRLGRLGSAEKAKRTVLYQATGLAADPRIVPAAIRDTIVAELGAKLNMDDVVLDPAAYLDTRAAGPYREPGRVTSPETLGQLYAFASYAARQDAAWAPARDALWQRVSAAA